jgi:hypothetical protein
MFALDILRQELNLVSAQVPLTTETFARKFKTDWHHRIVIIGDGLKIRFRALAKLVGKTDYLLKFRYIADNEEVPDLDYVLYTFYDPDMGMYCARKVRVVSKDEEYRNTARDESLVLGFDPETICDDLIAKFADRTEQITLLAHKLYKQALVHVGERHPELDRTVENPSPFDYAQEMLRVLKTVGKFVVAEDAEVSPKSAARLKEGEDVVVKLDLTGDGLKPETELALYLTPDELFGSIAIRKVRIRNKKANDYSDSDNDHSLTLDADPATAARELVEQLKDGELGQLLFDMIMRARHYMAGGDEDQF